MFGLFITVFDEESEFQVKTAQFQRPEVENRGSRFLIVGFLIVCLHRDGTGRTDGWDGADGRDGRNQVSA